MVTVLMVVVMWWVVLSGSGTKSGCSVMMDNGIVVGSGD